MFPYGLTSFICAVQDSAACFKCFPKACQAKKEVVASCFATCTLAQCPATASNVQFDLLCCQPRPVPETLSTRTPCFTTQCPCGLPAWLGRAINTHDPGRHNLLLLPNSRVTGVSPMFILALVLVAKNIALML